MHDIVRLTIAWDELELRQEIKEAGGRWINSGKTWQLPYKTAQKLGLETRMVDEEIENKETKGI